MLESENAIMVLDGLFIDDFKGSPQVCDRTFGNLLSLQMAEHGVKAALPRSIYDLSAQPPLLESAVATFDH